MEVSYCRMIKHSAHGLWGAWEGSWSEVLPQEADLVALAEYCSLCSTLGTPVLSKSKLFTSCFPVPWDCFGVWAEQSLLGSASS